MNQITQRPVWQSEATNGEIGLRAAERFVRESFGTERTIRWNKEKTLFTFADSAWWYRLEMSGIMWRVYRTADHSPAAKKRARARREARQ